MTSNCGVEHMKQCMMESWLGRRRLVLLIMLLMITVIGVVVQPTAADHVWIQNQMGETLEVHCMSGDDDLGWQILANGQIYGFGFSQNVWGTTLFWCIFRAQGYLDHHQDVFKGVNYLHHTCWCTVCNWGVSPSGFRCNRKLMGGWGKHAAKNAVKQLTPASVAPVNAQIMP
ncbi:unnamed protein product [Sphagnum jensenii]|uniref:S-protein homolog n=1 Tax=Sphagnum jensenii TaxID=128206 RepID=A0ABP1B9S8_9BRYO